MPNKSGSRKRSSVRKGAVDDSLALGTLAANVAIKSDFSEVVDEKMFALSIESTWSLNGITPGEGPIVVGIAHSDYTSAEVEEFLENQGGGWSQGDQTAMEIGRRKIRVVGAFQAALQDEVLNDGRPIKTKLRFTLATGKTLSAFAFNKSDGGLTTGGIMKNIGHVWLKPF